VALRFLCGNPTPFQNPIFFPPLEFDIPTAFPLRARFCHSNGLADVKLYATRFTSPLLPACEFCYDIGGLLRFRLGLFVVFLISFRVICATSVARKLRIFGVRPVRDEKLALSFSCVYASSPSLTARLSPFFLFFESPTPLPFFR